MKNVLDNILLDEYTPATVLNIICLKKFGSTYYNWDPEVVKESIELDIPQINLDKIQAIATILTTQTFYNYYEVFNTICRILNNNKPMFGSFIPCTIPELVWGIKEASLNDNDDEIYSIEVKKYIEMVMKKDGICRLPGIVDYNIFDTLDNYQKRLQLDFEKELNYYIKKRAHTIKKLCAQI